MVTGHFCGHFCGIFRAAGEVALEICSSTIRSVRAIEEARRPLGVARAGYVRSAGARNGRAPGRRAEGVRCIGLKGAVLAKSCRVCVRRGHVSQRCARLQTATPACPSGAAASGRLRDGGTSGKTGGNTGSASAGSARCDATRATACGWPLAAACTLASDCAKAASRPSPDVSSARIEPAATPTAINAQPISRRLRPNRDGRLGGDEEVRRRCPRAMLPLQHDRARTAITGRYAMTGRARDVRFDRCEEGLRRGEGLIRRSDRA